MLLNRGQLNATSLATDGVFNLILDIELSRLTMQLQKLWLAFLLIAVFFYSLLWMLCFGMLNAIAILVGVYGIESMSTDDVPFH